MPRLIAALLIALLALPNAAWAGQSTAVFAGGCFWCLEHDLEELPGVLEATSGYSGGEVERPTYRQVSSETTGHQEAVQVRFDPDQISYAELLRSYWRNVDPLDGEGQFCDRGDSYRPVIFTADGAQAHEAEASAQAAALELGRRRSDLMVELRNTERFWPAEDYHQDYAERQALTYNFYRWRCGRDARLDAVWGEQARSPAVWKTAPAFPTNAG